MRAVIRRDRATGWWHWDVTGHGLCASGEREHWEDALAEALDDMRWIDGHQRAWPEGLISLGWRPLRKLMRGYAC